VTAGAPDDEGDGASEVNAVKLADDERIVEDGIWRKVRETLGRIPFTEDAVAAYYCAIDRATPLTVKAILMGALAYFVMPADVIPDFIAGLGYTDDAAVLIAAIRAIRDHLRPEHRDKARKFLEKVPRGEG
jgi:uncharacterized membrane protein YkvA (DUF1232 family)